MSRHTSQTSYDSILEGTTKERPPEKLIFSCCRAVGYYNRLGSRKLHKITKKQWTGELIKTCKNEHNNLDVK